MKRGSTIKCFVHKNWAPLGVKQGKAAGNLLEVSLARAHWKIFLSYEDLDRQLAEEGASRDSTSRYSSKST